MIGSLVSVVAIGLGALVYALNTFDLLPKKKSAADAAAEILIAHQATERISGELAREQAKTRELERTRSLEPILQRLTENAEQQAESARQQAETAKNQVLVLEKLASFNGSLKAIHSGLDDTTRSLAETREGLSAAVEAIKFIAGQVVTDYIPAAPPPPKRRRATVKKEQP